MLTIIGCGNLLRCDDGVGVLLARRLAERLASHPIPAVQAIDCGTAGFEVMYRARGSTELVIMDACRTGGEPGTIYEVPGDVVASVQLPAVNLHEFRWDHAIGVGKTLYREDFPRQITVLLIEAAELGYGEQLSSPVHQASERVYQRVLDRVAAFAAAQQRATEDTPLALVAERGSLQVPRAVFERFFGDRGAAAILPRGTSLVLLPIFPEDGGLLVKQKNARGDRSIELRDAFRQQGWSDEGSLQFTAEPDAALGGLILTPKPTSPP